MITTIRVKPSSSLSLALPDPVPLHPIDLLALPRYVPIYLYFPAVSSSHPSVHERTLNLISSLTDVLEYFPLVAGSIRPDSTGKLHVYSDSTGVDFSYERRDEIYPGKHAKGLDPRGDIPKLPTTGDTLFAIKFTSFTCGACVLVISSSHILADLTSIMDFIYAYSQMATKKPLNTIPKNWNRDPFKYFPCSTPLVSEIQGLKFLPADHVPTPSPERPPAELLKIYTTTQKLAHIKSTLPFTTSSFQILAALIWRMAVRMLSTHIPDNDSVSLGIAADGRVRSPNKAMSKSHYFGNFVVPLCASMKKSDLLNGPIYEVALEIQRALKSQLTVEAIASNIKTMESIPSWRVASNTDFNLSSWPKELTLHEDLNFGLIEAGSGKKAEMGIGEEAPFPIGRIQTMMLNNEVYQVAIAVPKGMGRLLAEDSEVLEWGQFELPSV